jgi:hypothetical protein
MISETIHAPDIGWLRWEVALPPGFQHLDGPLPFIILMDCQNSWTNRGSYGGWHTDSIVRSLVSRKRLAPIVLLGLQSPPWRDRCYAPPPWGKSGLLADFLCNHLIPPLRQRFKLTVDRNKIGILGASFGANFALQAGLFRPDTFGLVGSFSAAPHAGESLHSMVAKRRPYLPFHRAYIDCGTLWAHDNPHGFGGDSTQFNRELMRLAGERLPGGRLRGRVWKGHFHNEEFWRKRVGPALRFLFAK